VGLRDSIKSAIKGALGLSSPGLKPASAPQQATPKQATPEQATPKQTTPAKPVSSEPSQPARAVPVEMAWQELAASTRVVEGGAGTFAISGTETVVAVFRHQGILYAMDNACAHEDGPVGEGEVKGTRVRCPYHDWEYDFTTGRCTNSSDRLQTCWHVKEKDGKILLGPIRQQGTAARGGDHNDGMEVIKK
jgi:nitrite reductase (NADH) small subunit